MNRIPSEAERNHLRRLLAWCECEVGQEPEQFLAIAPAIINEGNLESSRDIVTEEYNRLKSKPVYVRSAIKSLKKYLAEIESNQVVNGEFEEINQLRIE